MKINEFDKSINKANNFRNKIVIAIFSIFLSLNIVLCLCSKANNLEVSATNNYVVLGGESIGLGLNTSLRVTGLYEVYTDNGKQKPWSNSDVLVDDEIIKIDHYQITDIETFKNVLKTLKSGVHDLYIKRNSTYINTTIEIITNDKGVSSVGLYVKDKVIGVGTMTYYDINNKTFGALGHSAINMTVYSGELYNSKVIGVVKGIRGTPGEKKATLINEPIGTIKINNDFGVFGTFNNLETHNDLIKVASINEIKEGKATITTVIDGFTKETFDIEIIEVKKQNAESIKGIKFRVVDIALLEKTGGIIQGMSGSPIVQNGMLVGAVSHVLIDDSSIGYGVFAQWMINYT